MQKYCIVRVIKVVWCRCHTQGPWHDGLTSTMYLYQSCITMERNSTYSIQPIKGHCILVLLKYCIVRVIEVVWCRCDTPRPVSWWIYIHYENIPSLCHYKKQWMCSHHPQHYPSNQVSVTVELGYAIIWYIEGGWSGVIPLPHPNAHAIVYLHQLWTYVISV